MEWQIEKQAVDLLCNLSAFVMWLGLVYGILLWYHHAYVSSILSFSRRQLSLVVLIFFLIDLIVTDQKIYMQPAKQNAAQEYGLRKKK